MSSNGVLLPGQGKMSSTPVPVNGSGMDVTRKQPSTEDSKAMPSKEHAASLEQSLNTVHGIVPTLQ
jgi:hypothetical protein